MKNILEYITFTKSNKKQFREKVRTVLNNLGFHCSILDYRKEDGVDVLDIIAIDIDKYIWHGECKVNSNTIYLFDGKESKELGIRFG